ncbi:MAG: hypothetical protein ACLPPF_06580 [Rhodomicrobium sp.]
MSLPSVVDYLARHARNSARDPTPMSRPLAVSRIARPNASHQARVVCAVVAEKGLGGDLDQPAGFPAAFEPSQHHRSPKPSAMADVPGVGAVA